MRCYWGEEDIWFYIEVDSEGVVIRQVELQGPAARPVAAASLDEWERAQDVGSLGAYEAAYGFTAELPVSEREGHDPEPLTGEQFEKVWDAARRQIADRTA